MSTTPTIPSTEYSLIESIVNTLPPKAQQDARSLFQNFSSSIAQIQTQQGIAPGAKSTNIAIPPLPALSASGVNGAFTLTIAPPKLTSQATLWYRISYSPIKGMTSGVTQLQPSTSTSTVLNLPNLNLFFQVEASYTNQGPWSQPVLASQTAVSSGLVSSAITSEAGAFNQTNLGVVTSVAIGATAAVQVQGAGAALSSMTTLKGNVQSVLPAATIVGVAPGSTQFVGSQLDTTTNVRRYILRPTLGSLIADNITPVGVVSVVTTATPTPTTILPIFGPGGSIVGYNVTNGGAGAVAPYTLTLGSVGSGAGATFGAQDIVAGVLISVQPGNPGANYSSGTTVTATGGNFAPGSSGGGTSTANNQARLIAAYN
jgi:hypothetical protein